MPFIFNRQIYFLLTGDAVRVSELCAPALRPRQDVHLPRRHGERGAVLRKGPQGSAGQLRVDADPRVSVRAVGQRGEERNRQEPPQEGHRAEAGRHRSLVGLGHLESHSQPSSLFVINFWLLITTRFTPVGLSTTHFRADWLLVRSLAVKLGQLLIATNCCFLD